jgi:hypothetical protein
MLIPVRKPDGRVYMTLICDTCRRSINETDFPGATVDFSAIQQAHLESASAEELADAAAVLHFHAQCAPQRCVKQTWQKADSMLYAMAANVFNAPGSAIAKAALKIRRHMGPDAQFP